MKKIVITLLNGQTVDIPLPDDAQFSKFMCALRADGFFMTDLVYVPLTAIASVIMLNDAMATHDEPRTKQ